MVSCILLSAGSSTRFGSPKALAKVNGKTVIEFVLDSLIRSQVAEVIVVLGDGADEIKLHLLNHKKVKVVYNKDYLLGQISSFQVGLRAISPQSHGIMLLPVDVPFVRSATLNILIAEFLKKKPLILLPSFGGKKGHPPLLSSRLKSDLLKLDTTQGLNTFEHQHESEIVLVNVEDEGILRTFNTPKEFEKIKADFVLKFLKV